MLQSRSLMQIRNSNSSIQHQTVGLST